MYVNYSGWNNERGSFHEKIFIDETKRDYTIQYNDGTVMQQTGAFELRTADWNHDGDIYAQFGAWFHEITPDGKFGHGEFWTPEDMVRAVIDANDPDRPKYGNQVKSISNISIPSNEKLSSLDDRIRSSECRAMHKDIEINRKMNLFGKVPWGR